MTTYNFYAFYTQNGTAYAGGTVTMDLYGSGTIQSSGGTAVSMGGGLYKYTYNGGAIDPIAIFKNNDSNCDTMQQAALSVTSLTVATSQLGAGSVHWTYTLNDNLGNPIQGAEIWVTTDLAGTNIICSGVTDNYGQISFWIDAGSVYVWGEKAGYNFTNPTLQVVS